MHEMYMHKVLRLGGQDNSIERFARFSLMGKFEFLIGLRKNRAVVMVKMAG